MANGTRLELTKEIMEDLGSPCKNNEFRLYTENDK